MEALAFTIALSGPRLDRERQRLHPLLPDRHARRRSIVGWVFLGTAVPEILIMTLGARRRDVRPQDRHGLGRALAVRPHERHPPWFVVVFLIFAIVQIFGINSLDMYSSGVTLQAIGRAGEALPGRADRLRHRLGVTMYAIFSASFTHVPVGLRRHRHHLDRAVERRSSSSTGCCGASATCRASCRRPGGTRCTGDGAASIGQRGSRRSSGCSRRSRASRPRSISSRLAERGDRPHP